ncbi:MAG: type II secretion system F family protein [Clostridia bacterium]|nr:type II secretion system F family protein [Clostridia bacterium]
MPIYEYKAVASNGRTVSSKINIDGNEQVLREKLSQMGLRPISIKKKKFDMESTLDKFKRVKPRNKRAAIGIDEAVLIQDQAFAKEKANIMAQTTAKKKSFKDILMGDVSVPSFDFSAYLPIKIEEVISFTEMFLLLKRSNFTNIRAIQTLYNNASNVAMKTILGDMLNGLETGEYIYVTMKYYPKVFPEIYTNLIKVGEETGALVNALEQGLIYLNDTVNIKKKVRKALVGPIVQSILLIIGAIVCIYVGLPVMQDMYAQYGLTDQIPEATMKAANFVYWCGDHWFILLAGIIGIIVAFRIWTKTPGGKYLWDKFKLNAPIFGPLILRLQIQKFFIAVNINLKNNARLQDAIADSKHVVTNDVVRAAVEAAEANLIVGDSWIEPFEKMPKFPPMIKEMLRIGMETDMQEMIDNILRFINEDIEITIRRITATLPQVSMAIMGVVIIGFVIIILKPIMEVYMGSFLFEANGM